MGGVPWRKRSRHPKKVQACGSGRLRSRNDGRKTAKNPVTYHKIESRAVLSTLCRSETCRHVDTTKTLSYTLSFDKISAKGIETEFQLMVFGGIKYGMDFLGFCYLAGFLRESCVYSPCRHHIRAEGEEDSPSSRCSCRIASAGVTKGLMTPQAPLHPPPPPARACLPIRLSTEPRQQVFPISRAALCGAIDNVPTGALAERASKRPPIMKGGCGEGKQAE